MNVQGFQGGERDFGAEARIAETLDLLASASAAPPPAFVQQFLGAVAPEDLLAITAPVLADLASAAWDHVAARESGRHDVKVFNPEVLPGVTVIETVNDDMAFLFDSVAGELADRGLELKLVAHPILYLDRKEAGVVLLEGPQRKGQDGTRESLIHLHIPALGEAERAQLKGAIEQTLSDVRAVNEDFQPMRKQVRALAKGFRKEKRPYDEDDRDEASDLIEWLAEDNFIFLGVRQYDLTGDGGLVAEPSSGLGVLRDPSVHELRLGNDPVVTTPEIRAFLEGPLPLLFTKASLRSRVHRRAFMDYVGIKTHDEKGRLTGELRLIGLLTSTAYTHSVRQIPYLRLKADSVIKRAGLEPDSHSAKGLATVLETYPRDDLFQIDAETLLTYSREILSLYDRPRVRVLPRIDPFDRFVSVLVYIPRERFDSAVREAVGQRLAAAYGGQVSAFSPQFLQEVPLTRVHYIIGRREGRVPHVDRGEIEREIANLVMSWSEKLTEAITAKSLGTAGSAAKGSAAKGSAAKGTGGAPDGGKLLSARYAGAFGAGYVAAYGIETALADIDRLERLSAERPIAVDFYHRPEDPDTRISLRLLSYGQPLPLSTRVPMLENMGLRAINERTYRIEPAGGEKQRTWLHDMTLERADGGTISMDAASGRLEDCLNAVLRGTAENDGFNALVLDANLDWREAALVRTLGRYLRQAGIPFSQDYLWSTLGAHEGIAAKIVALFHARFDPAFMDGSPAARASREAPLRALIEDELAKVTSLDQDRILRRFVNLVDAALRTTFYQSEPDGRPKEAISIKFKSADVEGLPLPRPLYEVFVYSPRVEGVHLRFGPVARGGLRWSDRPQDFRTEVLGLVKAQQVKNAVIVPVGAKGGFVPKHLPAGGGREAIMAEGTAAYEIFVSSLLEITDNLKGGAVVHPADVVRLDGDDPYLVVAADKGTATFSDTANAISARHGFWLDDAFASGGSVGYDHKAMGITARGAWEAVKRHFREMDIDIQTTPITVAGVGDMSGDVFGNGMLLSTALKLVAAFDHRHIFLDPDPDPAAAHAERQRLFNLPRSSWADYDAGLISQGGGVFPRSAKSIVLSPEIKALVRTTRAEMTPTELISAILKAKVDLLFFGGIGTYVRASTETDAQAGDRANDAVRINATELGAKVVGEGANLGMTQRARIEAARRGVRLNTDAIDNSAGVNTSDVEVNIKIALAQPLEQGILDREDRAALLKEMTDDVARLVLANNYSQTLALSLAELRGVNEIAFQQRLMQMLELRGELDRQVEFLPSDMEISDRRSRGESLTRPELAVLLAYAKLALHADLLTCPAIDDPYFARELCAYFPPAIEARFPEAIATHRLRRDIIATRLANALINEGGPAAFARIADQTGADAGAIARAYVCVRDSYRLPDLTGQIDALDAKIDGDVQLSLYAAVEDLLIGRTIWFLRNAVFDHGVEGVIARYAAGIGEVSQTMQQSLPEAWRERGAGRAADLVEKGVPEALAQRIVVLPALAAATDIAMVADSTGRTIADAATTFFAAGRYFSVDDLVTQARIIATPDYYDRLALDRSLGELETFLRRATVAMLAKGGQGDEAVEAFVGERRAEVERMRATVKDIAASGLSLSKLTLAASLLSDLTRG